MAPKKRRKEREDPFDLFDAEVAQIRERMDEILERMLSRGLKEGDPFVYEITTFSPELGERTQRFDADGDEEVEKGEEREPLVDVMESPDRLTVLMHLPCLRKEDIKVRAEANTLEIEVDDPERGLREAVDLPCSVRPGSAKANYKNGVLEVVLEKQSRKKPRKRQVEVD